MATDAAQLFAAAPDAEPTHPFPPRFWWLKRFGAVAVLLVISLGGLRWWWGTLAQRRMDAAIAAAHARGEKILLADFKTDRSLPDERNAATYYNRAAKALNLNSTEEWAVDNAEYLRDRPDIAAVVQQVLKDHAAPLADIRRAREAGRADWGVNIVSPMWSVLLPHLNPARQLARLSCAAALDAAERGDHAAAIEHLRDAHALGASLEDGNVFLITHLVRVGVESHALDTLAQIVPDLQIEGGTVPTTQPASVRATREQARAMINLLLDDAARAQSIQEALQGERAAQVDIGMTVAKRARLVRPSIQMDTLGLVKEGEQAMAAAAAPNWPASRRQFPVPPKVEGPRMAAHAVSQSIRPALQRSSLTSLRVSAQSRLAATALAIRMYQHDHGGQRPPNLAALVPDYLPAVPIDPLAPGTATIGYVRDATPPYVYSVGDNGADDSAGVPLWRPDATSPDPLKAADLFLPLTRENAPPPKIDDPPAKETLPPTTGPATTNSPA
jgi:hypothetical protein